jgi:Leucine-rich repeat (LRR) protein
MKLTPAILSQKIQQKLSDVTKLDLQSMEITCIDDLSSCRALRRLDLASNALKDPDALAGLQHCRQLAWLNLQKNSLSSITFIGSLANLQGSLYWLYFQY